MLHIIFQAPEPSGSGEEDFFKYTSFMNPIPLAA